MTYKEKKQIVTLRRYYEIYGQGRARLKINQAVRSPRFQAELARLEQDK